MPQAPPPFTLTQAKFARYRGVSPKTVTKWKQAGLLVLTGNGMVDVAASDARLDERPENYRGGSTVRPAAPDADAEPPIETEDDLSLADAIRRKENYLGLLRKRDLEIIDGQWVRIEDVTKQVAREYAVIRERFLGLYGKMSGSLTPEQAQRLNDEVREALEELSDPDRFDAMIEAQEKQAKRRNGK